MRRPSAIAAFALLLAACMPTGSCGASSSGKRVLVLVQTEDLRTSHSQFFQGLRDAGLEVEIKSHRDSDLALRRHDDALYDHLVLFTPRAGGEGAHGCKCWLDGVKGGSAIVVWFKAGDCGCSCPHCVLVVVP